MSTRSNLKWFVVGAVAYVGYLALAVPAAPLSHLMPTDALIVNTSSTNTSGYTFYVSPRGAVQFVGSTHPSSEVYLGIASLPKAQTKKLFQDLAAAWPLTSLHVRHGLRSASFGTATYITYKGQKSPDLTFGGDARANALKADIGAITQALHVGNTPRRPLMRPLIR